MIIKHFDPFASSKVAPHLLQALTKIKQVEKSILRWTWSWELYVNMIEKFILKMWQMLIFSKDFWKNDTIIIRISAKF